MAELARLLPAAAAALCLCLCTVAVAHPANGSGGAQQSFGALFCDALQEVCDRVQSGCAAVAGVDTKAGAETAPTPTPTAAVATGGPGAAPRSTTAARRSAATRRPPRPTTWASDGTSSFKLQRAASSEQLSVASEYALLVGRMGEYARIARYSPLDRDATKVLVNDKGADVPSQPSCAYFDHSVYCVGGVSKKTWRFSHVDGSPLPPGPDLNRNMMWPGNGRMANINDEWLVTCGDMRGGQSKTCHVLHVNARYWVEIDSEACDQAPAVAQHNGSVFVVGGVCSGRGAEVWSLQVGRTAAGKDTFQWQRHPDMKKGRRWLAIASHKGYLYACGGHWPWPGMSDCERWQEGMQSWQAIAPMPEARYGLHMLSVDGRLIALGGVFKFDVFDYDQAEDTWSRLHHIPHITWFGSAVVPAGAL